MSDDIIAQLQFATRYIHSSEPFGCTFFPSHSCLFWRRKKESICHEHHEYTIVNGFGDPKALSLATAMATSNQQHPVDAYIQIRLHNKMRRKERWDFRLDAKRKPNNDDDRGNDDKRGDGEWQRNRSMELEHPTSNSNFIRFKFKRNRRTKFMHEILDYLCSRDGGAGFEVRILHGMAWRKNCFAMGKLCTNMWPRLKCAVVRHYGSEIKSMNCGYLHVAERDIFHIAQWQTANTHICTRNAHSSLLLAL